MLRSGCDQDVPAWRHREVLQDRLKGGHPAETRSPITHPADHLESGFDAAGYEPEWMGLASAEGTTQRSLVGERQRELAPDLHLQGRRCDPGGLSGLPLRGQLL